MDERGERASGRHLSMRDLSVQYREWCASLRPGPSRKVLILGAGLAGLCAARELKKLGHDVQVIEARDRPGGRVLTLREPFQDGLYAEAGAIFIPEQHALTVSYSKLFGLTLQPLPESEAQLPHYYIEGRLIKDPSASDVDWPVELTDEEKKAGIVGMNQNFLRSAIQKIGNPRAQGWPTPEAAKFDTVSFYDFLVESGASPGAITLLRCGYYDLWGDGVAACSALALIRDTALMVEDPENFAPLSAWHRAHSKESETYTIQGGNDLLPIAFAESLGEMVTYSSPVEALAQDSSGVSVHCGGKTYKGDFIVCTIPFSVLRDMEVKPAFDKKKATAVRELPYTAVARIYLETSRRFWEEEGMGGVVVTDLPLAWVCDASFGQLGKRGILESYCAGARARGVTAMEPEHRIATALRLFEKVYPGIEKHFDGHSAVKCWDEDPWMKGDYCWFKPGQMVRLLPDIARPAGRVHFAGDHTSALPGWMQGAFESALRVVTEVNAAAAKK